MLTWQGGNEDYLARMAWGEYQIHLVDSIVAPWEAIQPQLYVARVRHSGATESEVIGAWPLSNLTPQELEEKRSLAK